MEHKKLNEVSAISTLQDTEYILVTMADGSVGKIKKSDLYPLATESTNGLMSKDLNKKINNIPFVYGYRKAEEWIPIGACVKLAKINYSMFNGQNRIIRIDLGGLHGSMSGLITVGMVGSSYKVTSAINKSTSSNFKLILAREGVYVYVYIQNNCTDVL